MIRRTAEYRAGMPNLSLAGLSENWLLKECGHQHWLALANLQGQTTPDFQAANGAPVYAAFVAVKVSEAQLHLIDENDHFIIETRLNPSGRSRFFSRHRVSGMAGLVCEVEMISTLVSRTEPGNNQSVCRSDFATAGTSAMNQFPPSQQEQQIMDERAERLLLSFRQFRAVDNSPATVTDALADTPWRILLPHWRRDEEPLYESTFLPCPHSDFNGADFLYFANFQQMIDRAEWQQLATRPAADSPSWLWQPIERQLSYYGNINPGDQLRIACLAERIDKHRLVHWQRIYRVSDGRCIADAVTAKQAQNDSGYRRLLAGQSSADSAPNLATPTGERPA